VHPNRARQWLRAVASPEGTHVHFFSHHSLRRALAPHFRSARFFQIARGELEGQFMPGSLAAIATK
jgi:hypothetical protein